MRERAEHRRGQQPDDEPLATDGHDVALRQHPIGGCGQRHAERETDEDGDHDQHDVPDATPPDSLSAHE